MKSGDRVSIDVAFGWGDARRALRGCIGSSISGV